MAIKNALRFLGVIDQDNEFRNRLNTCLTKADLMECLSDHHLHFTEDEFEESVRLLHLQCQDWEQADALLHKAEWLRFLFTMN